MYTTVIYFLTAFPLVGLLAPPLGGLAAPEVAAAVGLGGEPTVTPLLALVAAAD